MSQASRLKNHGHVQPLIKKENATTAENAGIKKFKLLYMENTNMFKHPKYYKELRDAGNELAKRDAVKEDLARPGSSPARNKSDQVISKSSHDGESERAPGPGHKLQASSFKPRVASSLTREPWNMDIGEVLGDKGPRVFIIINVF
tara:strand:+ start:41 stop:478 length:438 start_codon:yes stop_codon:yes gene_type:complete